MLLLLLLLHMLTCHHLQALLNLPAAKQLQTNTTAAAETFSITGGWPLSYTYGNSMLLTNGVAACRCAAVHHQQRAMQHHAIT
jgi:hypothetical protein